MKGEIFNLLEQFIISLTGEKKFEEIYESALSTLETKTPFVGPDVYPDEDFVKLVNKAVSILGVEKESAIRAFGRFSFSRLLARIPQDQRQYPDLKTFLMSVNDVIHERVKTLSDANPPSFAYEDPSPKELVMVYRSKRRLFDFVEGMLEGAAEYFLTNITIERVSRSEEECSFRILFK